MKAYTYSIHNGIRIYENKAVNRPGRVPIVLVHGMWGFALIFRIWFALGEALGYKVYSVQLRGHTPELACADLSNQSVKTYIRDVDKIIRTEIGDCVLVGWSMGGLICQDVAAQNSNVQKLVLVTSASPAGILLRGKVLIKLMKPRYLWAMLTGNSFRITKNDAAELMFNAGFDQKTRDEFISELNPESGRAAREMATHQIGVNKIPCPVLVIGAEMDAITPVSLQRAIAKKYKAQYVQITGASHAIMLQPGVRDEAFRTIIEWAYGNQARLAKAA